MIAPSPAPPAEPDRVSDLKGIGAYLGVGYERLRGYRALGRENRLVVDEDHQGVFMTVEALELWKAAERERLRLAREEKARVAS